MCKTNPYLKVSSHNIKLSQFTAEVSYNQIHSAMVASCFLVDSVGQICSSVKLIYMHISSLYMFISN